MVSMKILFHLLEEGILQTGTSKQKLTALSVTGTKLLTGVTQGLILGSLFFIALINDLISFANKSETFNYADDNTLYSANKNIIQIIMDLLNNF